jgi:hypothetical protein
MKEENKGNNKITELRTKGRLVTRVKNPVIIHDGRKEGF